MMYQILYLTYFSERKLANREAILAELERIGFQMSMVTYHSYLNMAIKAIDRILWGYTARDCMESSSNFCPELKLNYFRTVFEVLLNCICIP